MATAYHQFIKDINKIDIEDICSDWQWLLNHEYLPIMTSMSGDMFLSDKNGAIIWLDTGTGQLKIIARNLTEFLVALEDVDNIENWLLVSTILGLIQNGLILKDNEVYSYKIMPILNGDYSLTNFEATDMSIHFSVTGQICKQLQHIPNGTNVSKVSFVPPNHSTL